VNGSRRGDYLASRIRKDSRTEGLTGSPQNRNGEATRCSKCFEKSFSDGQSGADPVGLDFPISAGLEHGGFVLRGRKTEDGRIDDRYNLVELTTSSYPARTRRNIGESDGSLIFSLGHLLSGGTKPTRDYANKLGKPLLRRRPYCPGKLPSARKLVEGSGSKIAANGCKPTYTFCVCSIHIGKDPNVRLGHVQEMLPLYPSIPL
jgi:Circularly permutated YpsA SLOG family